MSAFSSSQSSRSPSSRGRGLKCFLLPYLENKGLVALFTRAWIEIFIPKFYIFFFVVALFTRAWIEIRDIELEEALKRVALFTRAWIEIVAEFYKNKKYLVALFTRAWIEIHSLLYCYVFTASRPLHEGVD